MTDVVATRDPYLRRIWERTLQGTGVKFALVWVGLLVFAAVFAPFLANSMPLIMSKNGQISMPVLHYLSREDVVVLIAFMALIILWVLPLRLNWRRGLAVFSLVMVAGVIIANQYVNPPKLIIYEDFRTPAYHQVDWKIMPLIPYAPTDYMRDARERGLQTAPLSEPSLQHWMGTEENGAEVFSRMIHASRIALSIGIIATSISMVIGVIIGGIMGYFSGVVDMIGMRLVEIFEAIPTLFLLLTFVAFFGRSLYMMMVIIGVTSWSGYARYIRAEFLKLRKQDYVQAAIASGLPLRSILFRHMLPNGVAPLLVAASFGVASAILAEATLSFLGLGLVDAPSWGQMLDQAVKSGTFNWWMAVFPGGAIFMTVFAYTLIGEAFRDAIDPKTAYRVKRSA